MGNPEMIDLESAIEYVEWQVFQFLWYGVEPEIYTEYELMLGVE